MSKLTHISEAGTAHMVDVGAKDVTERRALAEGFVRMNAQTRALILENGLKKGDVLATARIAGIMAAKRTSDLIPLCHPLPLTHVRLDITPATAPVTAPSDGNGGDTALRIVAEVRTRGRTGVEMEALTAVSVAALTIYDMAKAVDRAMVIGAVRLLEKDGGKSGPFRHPGSGTDVSGQTP